MTKRALALLLLLGATPTHADTAAPLAPCNALYADVVFDGMVDYERLAAHPGRPACVAALASARPPAQGAGALAFWVNAYNLLSLLALADEPERWSAQQDGGVLFRDKLFTVAGRQLTLDQIEKGEIAAQTRDPRVEFLLSCGSRSCALLPPRVLDAIATGQIDPTAEKEAAGRLDAAMSDGLRRWFARPDNLRVRHEAGVVELGQLLQREWHGADFERAGVTLVRLVAEALQTRDPVAAKALREGRYRLTVRPYDWRVNRVRRTYLLP